MSESMEVSENKSANLENSGGTSMDQEEGVNGGKQDELLPSDKESANLPNSGGNSKDQEEGLTGGEQDGNSNDQEEGVIAEEQHKLLALVDVVMIMKKALPADAQISQEAKEAMQICAAEFISFITCEAIIKCENEDSTEISTEDLIQCFETFDFKDYVESLKFYRNKFWEAERKEGWERNRKALADEFPHSDKDNNVEAENTGAAKLGETSSPSLTMKNKDALGSGGGPSGGGTSGNIYGYMKEENTGAAVGGETSGNMPDDVEAKNTGTAVRGETSGNMPDDAEAENTGAAMGGETSGNKDNKNKEVFGSGSQSSGGETTSTEKCILSIDLSFANWYVQILGIVIHMK